jgi:UDP-N-acetyl-D-glucosamine dehydrogenase
MVQYEQEDQMKEQIINKIKTKDALIGIIGLGYVGLPLALRFVEAGFRVRALDIDRTKVDMLNRGQSYIKHIGTNKVSGACSTGRFEATADFSRSSETDALILCVPTPLGKHQEPDLSYVIATFESILPYLRRGQFVSLESTTYPGTTDEELRTRIEKNGLKVGADVFLVFSPEREDPGNARFTTSIIPKVVGGTTPACLEVGIALYGSIIENIVPVSSTQAAEMTKLLENIYRAVNIGLVNELKIVADRMGIDIWEVVDAAATKPFGFTPFYPGPGLGGHCIPIDPFYLTWKAKEYGIDTRFIELAGQVNTKMPEWVVGKMMDALNTNGKSLKGAKILVLGIAYKKNIDDMRESPSVELVELLSAKEAIVSYSDPHVPSIPKMRKHRIDLRSVDLSAALLRDMDCVLIATDHDAFDYDLILKNSRLIVDTRGRYRKKCDNVVRA